MKVLHILPRWIGGGPERDLIKLARQDAIHGWNVERRVLVLDRPISAPLLISARRVGLALVNGDWHKLLDEEVSAADIVEIDYWNHPLMLELLQRELVPSRVLIRTMVAGNTLPQVISQHLARFPDLWVSTSPEGYGIKGLGVVPGGVHHVPALANMQRLEGFARRHHVGIRAAYLGSLEPTKLHHRFPEIVQMTCEAVSFDLFGDAVGDSIALLSRRLAELHVSNRVTLHGHVEDISTALANIDLFVYPLNPGAYVTSEKALHEAMWVGLPPVLLSGTAAEGWVDNGKTGFVAPDLPCFAREIEKLSRDEQVRRQIGQAAQTYARRNFNPLTNSRKLRGLCLRLLDLPKRTREPLHASPLVGAELFLSAINLEKHEFQKLLRLNSQLSEHEWLLLLRGEGGLIHYRQHFPHDSNLEAWVNESRVN